MRRSFLCLPVLAFTLHAAVIGTMQPAQPLTRERVAALPAADQAAWLNYLVQSDKARASDQAALQAEMRTAGLKAALAQDENHGGSRSMPLDRDAAFYASPLAHATVENILTYQTPAGGWSKNINMGTRPRRQGELYAPDNQSHFLVTGDADTPRDAHWSYVGTIDNDATTTEIRFLSLVAAQAKPEDRTRYQQSIERGVRYLLAAQYPNGGWPQVYPLEGGYHDAITYNDDAMVQALETLTLAATSPDYAFLPSALRQQAAESVQRGIGCILRSQIAVDGKPTIWGQQHDLFSLQPTGARNFEPASFSSSESASLLDFLMQLPSPSPAVVRAIYGGAAWLDAHGISGYVYRGGQDTPGGRRLFPDASAPRLWARYYDLKTAKPIFGDRDKSIHDELSEISLERRNGYAWYNTQPNRTLAHFSKWMQTHPLR